MRSGLFAIFSAAILCLTASGQSSTHSLSISELSPDQAFDRANAEYERERYQQAAEIFQALVDQGVSSQNLFFNLGNAYLMLERRGLAIAAYHQAAAFSHDDPAIRRNLAIARRGITGAPKLPSSIVERAVLRLSLNELALLISGALWIFCLAQASRNLWPSQRTEFRWVSSAAAGLGLLFLVWLSAHLFYLSRIPDAVISSATPVRYGPFDASRTSFTAQDGLEVTLMDEKGDWRQVQDSDGRVGWVRDNQLLPIAI